MIANYHTHTPRCGHAVGSEREYIERAIEGGIEILGFSDHAPYRFDRPGRYPGVRMEPEMLPDYAETFFAMRNEYAGKIELHLGVEAEYFGFLHEPGRYYHRFQVRPFLGSYQP